MFQPLSSSPSTLLNPPQVGVLLEFLANIHMKDVSPQIFGSGLIYLEGTYLLTIDKNGEGL